MLFELKLSSDNWAAGSGKSGVAIWPALTTVTAALSPAVAAQRARCSLRDRWTFRRVRGVPAWGAGGSREGGGLGQLSLAGLSATPLLLGAGQVRWRRWGSWVRHSVNGETVSRGFGHSVGFQVFDVNSEDLLSGRGSEVVYHWREDFRDGVRAGVFGS
jgi:hypothetical protein